jgi:rubrerythrin
MADDVLVILQQAINKEEDRQAYYEDAAQRACNPLAQKTFAFLAAQEKQHAQYVKSFYAKMEAEKAWPDASLCGEECKLAADEIKVVFADARAAIDGEVTCDTSLTEAYDLAMQGERDAIDFYKAQFVAATDPNAQMFYSALLAAERMHLQLLAKTQEFLDDTESWYFREEQWLVEG